MVDSDDDDYELPSLAERIQASFKTSSILKPVKTFDSDSEESEFLQFSERIRNTPCSQVKLKFIDSSDSENEDSGILKSSEKVQNTLSSEVKLQLHLSSSSDSDSEESEFLKFSEKIRNTPQSQYGLKHHKRGDYKYDDELSNFAEKISRIQLSKLQKGKQHYVESDSDSDGTFSNSIAKFREINTPKSQNKYSKTAASGSSSAIEKFSLPNPSEFLGGKSTASEDMPESSMDARVENKKEYDSLFPSRTDDSLFSKKRAFYAKSLFEFFNRKIFNNQLPKDMPLIWDESLMKTAGLTCCKVKKNVYSCLIKLSSKLLTSFDRLQDTLLHEMCHAAVWMINKQNVAHGPLWQLWASRSKLILPFIDCPARCHNYDVTYRFWYQCPSCKWKRGTCRRVKRYHGAVCKRCNVPIILTVNN